MNAKSRPEHRIVHGNIPILHSLSHVALAQNLVIFDLLLNFWKWLKSCRIGSFNIFICRFLSFLQIRLDLSMWIVQLHSWPIFILCKAWSYKSVVGNDMSCLPFCSTIQPRQCPLEALLIICRYGWLYGPRLLKLWLLTEWLLNKLSFFVPVA